MIDERIKPGSLRIAAYPDPELLSKLDTFCGERGIDRNKGMRHILRVMLNVDEGDMGELRQCVSMLEEQVNRLKQIAA
jgi:hypothetical protein